MSAGRRIAIWVGGFVAAYLVLWYLSPILLPFVLGVIIAYLLDPLLERFTRLGVRRSLGAAVIIAVFFVVLLVAIALLLPILRAQIVGLTQQLVGATNKLYAEAFPLIERALAMIGEGAAREGPGGYNLAGDLVGRIVAWTGTVLASIWSGGLAFFNLLSLIFVTPIVAFYLLRDWNRILAAVDGWLPRDHADTIRDLARQIDMRLDGFIRGQGLVCLLLGVFYAVALTTAGLNFGLLVGLGTGLATFIPYVGMMAGMTTGLLIAYFQFAEWTDVLIVLAIFVVGGIVEGNFIAPKLVGDRVDLHPVWIILALLAGGALFGFVGVLLAVPVAAALGVVLRFGLGRYLASPLYHGRDAAASNRPPAEPGS